MAHIIEFGGSPYPVQNFPGANLKGFGVNPLGHPLYRCVWSESRMHQVGGKWPDGGVEYRWIPRYPAGGWVLEKWLSAMDFAGPKFVYEATMKDESGLYPCGPYPINGEYEHCYTFPDPCTVTMIEKIIGAIEAGRRFSAKELAAAHMHDLENQQAAWMSRAMEIWRESQGAFGNAPSNLNPAKLTADKMGIGTVAHRSGDGKMFTA